MSQLVSNCREMKENAFCTEQEAEFTVSLPSRGSRLIQGTRNCRFSRSEIVKLLTEAFVPQCKLENLTTKNRGVALSALGLPYEQDPVLTKQIASFLTTHKQHPFPRHILFNGGVFQGTPIRDAAFGHSGMVRLRLSSQMLLKTLTIRVSRCYRYGINIISESGLGWCCSQLLLSVERRNKKGKRKGDHRSVLPKGTPTRSRSSSPIKRLVWSPDDP